MKPDSKVRLFLWSSLILIACLALTFYLAVRVKAFLEASQITPPQVSLQLPLAYFFGAVIVLGIILFLIPISKLRMALRVMFAFLYFWGMFIALGLSLPFLIAVFLSLASGLLWLFRPTSWLHNLLMVFALASVGAVFGSIFSAWTVIFLMLAISVYDVLAVRLGYMMWLTKKLSQSDTLPAFVIPERLSGWNLNLRKFGFGKLLQGSAGEREFSILGGGDLGFPLLLFVSVFLAYGLTGALIVALFALLGLISAYAVALFLLKGKPTPALPPITLLCFIGFLIVYFKF